MAGANIDRCQIWQASRITKKLLSLLNSPPSLCAEYKVSSKLEHLLFFVQNYGLTDDRCQQLQVSILTAVKNYKKILSLLNSPPSLCAENEVLSKLKHLPFFVQNYGLKDDSCQHWQLSWIIENYCSQWIQHLQIVHYAKFRRKWLTSFPVPHSPIPAPRSPF